VTERSTDLSTRGSSSAERQNRSAARVNVGDAERWVSAIGGGALALYGLRRSLGGLALAVGGGMLLYRGVTGHCAAYQSLGMNTASDQSYGAEEAKEATNLRLGDQAAATSRQHETPVSHPESVMRSQ
jgi:hypothetical protein